MKFGKKLLEGYNEKVRDIKKMALTGLAGLVVGAGGAGGAWIGNPKLYVGEIGPKDTTIGFTFFREYPEENMGVYSYKLDLWNNSTGESLGSKTKIDLNTNIDNYIGFFHTTISLYSLLENANWQPEEGLGFKISREKSPLRNPGTEFNDYQNSIWYATENSSSMNLTPIPEPYTLGLLALGAAALKKSRKNKK